MGSELVVETTGFVDVVAETSDLKPRRLLVMSEVFSWLKENGVSCRLSLRMPRTGATVVETTRGVKRGRVDKFFLTLSTDF